MCVNHPHNPLPYLILKVCCDDAGVHAQTNEKPKGIRCSTTPIPEGLGFRMRNGIFGGVSFTKSGDSGRVVY